MKDILISRDRGVLTISFNRIEKKNALTDGMYRDLASALTGAASDAEVRVCVICGTEQVFSAGNDLDEFASVAPEQAAVPALDFLNALNVFPKPVLAGVCGSAIGIGATMLLHCDLVFAGGNARFSMPFVNLGLCPEAASSMLLPKLAGYQRAAEILLTGAAFDAEKALAIGLVNKVLQASLVLQHVQSLARELAEKPASALAETKRLMKMTDPTEVASRMSDEFAVFRRMLTEGAAKEALAAFREKRPADFRGF
jgi:enoyl-CoA hydratase/carnithine racemase